jgi:hypothetical protein
VYSPGLGVLGNRNAEPGGIEIKPPWYGIDHWIAREYGTIIANDRIIAAGGASDLGVEFVEIARQHGHRDDSFEGAVCCRPAAGNVEEAAVEAGQAWFEHLPDKGADIALLMCFEIRTIG